MKFIIVYSDYSKPINFDYFFIIFKRKTFLMSLSYVLMFIFVTTVCHLNKTIKNDGRSVTCSVKIGKLKLPKKKKPCPITDFKRLAAHCNTHHAHLKHTSNKWWKHFIL